MIDIDKPDYTNTPASDRRPSFHYEPRDYTTPILSIITPFYNTGSVFQETVRSIQRMSLAHWEWIIVDDGSTNTESLAQLERLQEAEPRVQVIHQANGGPAVARNRAAREARGRYLLLIDSDDLVEPTFAEKAVWFLETQPQFAACNSYNVGFGIKNFLWSNGFHGYEKNINANQIPLLVVFRIDAFFKAGGFDESIIQGHEDWALWLNLAEVGHWGYTLPEYLTWYRYHERSRRSETEGDSKRSRVFHKWLHQKHRGLASRFPHPRWESSMDIPSARITGEIPVKNTLLKPEGMQRVLFIVPWLEMGGADKFNLDLIQLLSQRGYEFTMVSTEQASDDWKSQFTSITPDVFCLHQFLNRGDYPRFLNYLIDSRQIDTVLISNSELAYLLVPYLRAHHPNLPMFDYTHMEQEYWKDGGYPAMSVRVGSQLDLNLTSTDHLKRWMGARGADPDRIEVVHTNVDIEQWNPQHYNPLTVRQRLGIAADLPLILFVGRIVDQKRPLLFARIIRELAARCPGFLALVVGSGPELGAMKAFVTNHRLEQHIRFMGALPNPQVRELMAAGDILLLPSMHEGLALVLYECMAMETVPVAAAVGGHAELVTPECGYLIAPGEREVEEYIEALMCLLRDPQRRRRMGEQARQLVGEHFDIERMADSMEYAFQRTRQLAEARPAGKPDLQLARYFAFLAIEYTRIQELSDYLWVQKEEFTARNRSWSHRPLKRRILPFGSRRHEAYKRVRRGVEQAIHLMGNLPDVIKKGR